MLLLRKAHPATRTMIGGDPTPEQAMAGDYPKLRREWHGLAIAIEHPEGTVREGVDETGKPWRTVFRYAYGEIMGTLGMDGDPVDVFIGSYPDAPEVYIVQQMKRKQWDVADEQKVMIDFGSIDEAKAAYLGHYDDPRFFGGITAMPVDEFIAKVQATVTSKKPAMIKAIFLKTHVDSYTKKDGTFVAAHEDKRVAAKKRYDDYSAEKFQKYGPGWVPKATDEEKAEFERLRVAMNEAAAAPDVKPSLARKRSSSSSEETVTLYHRSPEKHIPEIKDGGRFGGLFAHTSRESAVGPNTQANEVHRMEVPAKKIATKRNMENLSGKRLTVANKVLREHARKENLSSSDLGLLREVVLDERDVYRMDERDTARLHDLLGTDDLGELSWDLQKIRGQVARALGYSAVEMSDEHGTSHLVLPGVKIQRDDGQEMTKSQQLPVVLFFKGFIGPYLRGGKIVNARGYQGRSARAQASAGQMSLFGAGEPQHTEPTRELIEEHERLVDVLNSPSHEDDKVEAKKQAAELAEYKEEAGTSERPHPTETPQFKRWFDGSKVVDDAGKPLMVFHTTPNDFDEFKPGGDDSTKSGHAMWFGVDAHNPQAAHNVLQGRRVGKFKDGVRSMPVYLSMKRPLVIDKTTREWARSVWGSDFPQVIGKETVEDLRQEYDGVIFHSPLTGKPSEYIVFDPRQIKSAIGNNGDFDPDSQVITKSIVFLRKPS